MAPRSFELDDSTVALGRAIRFLRTEGKLSQEELALRAGTHPTYVSHIESGGRNITWTALQKISAALGVPAYELVRLAEEFERR
jgi:transcriptional regulator with XRE-family HTH domain